MAPSGVWQTREVSTTPASRNRAGVQKSNGFSAGHEVQQDNAGLWKKQRMTALRPRKIRLFKAVSSGPVGPHGVWGHRAVPRQMAPRLGRVG
jgi:hypothetical protein